MRTLGSWVAAAVLAGLAALVWYQGHAAPPVDVALTVNGAAVPTRALLALAADRASFAQFRAQLIEQEIAGQLVRQEAARRGVALTEPEERAVDGRMPPASVLDAQARALGLPRGELAQRRREAVRTELLLRRLLAQDFPGELEPDEAALRRAFDELPEAYAAPPAAVARAFVVTLPDPATDAEVAAAAAKAARLVDAARQAATAEDFVAIAARAGALPDGLVDGKVGALTLADPFSPPPEVPALLGPALTAEVASALFPAPGAASERVIGPFRGPTGIYGLYVEERRGPSAPPRFEQARDRVRERWIGRAVMALAPKLIERLRASATIELNQGAIAS